MYNEAIEMNPTEVAIAYFRMGRVLLSLGDLPRAIENFEIALNDKSVDLYLEEYELIGDAFLKDKRLDDACEAWDCVP